MQSSSLQIQQKQSYIYKHILQSDYDIQQFALYLSSVGPCYSSNLQMHSLEQIKKSISNFISQSQKPKQRKIQKFSQQAKSINKSKVDYVGFQYYSRGKECVKEINKFVVEYLQLDIVSFRKNQAGFLGRDYVTFRIEIQHFNKAIHRRFTDFQWLISMYNTYHPGIIIPPLPKKKMKKIFTQDHLKKKGKMLQSFLRKCLQIPELRNCDLTYKFLTLDNIQKFQQVKKQNRVPKDFLPLQKLHSPYGFIQYGITQQSINLITKSWQYFKTISPIMKNLYKEIKRIQQNLAAIQGHFRNLQGFSKDMDKLGNDLTTTNGSFFNHLTTLANKYQEQIKISKQIWEKQLYVRMKYQFHLSQAFSEQIDQYKSLQKQFYSKSEDLKKKKLKLFNKPMSDWGLSPQIKQKFQNDKPKYNQASKYLLIKKSQQLFFLQQRFALLTKQLSLSIIYYNKNNNTFQMKILQRFLGKDYEQLVNWTNNYKSLIGNQFQMKHLISSKETYTPNKQNQVNRNSIKGFFSQFDSKNSIKSTL